MVVNIDNAIVLSGGLFLFVVIYWWARLKRFH